MSDSVQPHRWQPTRLLCPWDSPGKNTGVGCHFLLQCVKNEVTQSSPTLSDPMDCSPPGSSVPGILQARVLEWGAISFSFCCWQQKAILGFYRISWKVIKLVALSLALLPKKSPLLTGKEKCKMWQIIGKGQHRHMTGQERKQWYLQYRPHFHSPLLSSDWLNH